MSMVPGLVLTLNIFADTDPTRLLFQWTVVDDNGSTVTTQSFTRQQIETLHTGLGIWLETTR